MTGDRTWATCPGAAAAGGQHAHVRDAQVDLDCPAVAELAADVAAVVARQAAAVPEDVSKVILGEIPQLDDDEPLRALLCACIASSVETCLQVMQYRIDLADVRAPAVAVEYARRLAQRGIPLTALLRACRLGHAGVSGCLLTELAEHTSDAKMIIAAALAVSRILAEYLDQVCEQMADVYTRERENWLRRRNAAWTARIGDLLSGERVSVSAAEAALSYRLRQYHVGLVCWTAGADSLTGLGHAVSHLAAQIAGGEPVFLPRDQSSAWAWLPLGIRDRSGAAAAAAAGADGDLHFAFGQAAWGLTGFRLTHQQALAAQAVALAAGSPPRVVTFGQVAPVAMMLGSADLLRAWVLATLGGLATDDEHHARLRDTLLVFLQSGSSYKTAAEQMVLHKNTVHYRIRKAEESLGRPAARNRYDIALALKASHWLGSTVLQPSATVGRPGGRPGPDPSALRCSATCANTMPWAES